MTKKRKRALIRANRRFLPDASCYRILLKAHLRTRGSLADLRTSNGTGGAFNGSRSYEKHRVNSS